MLSGQEVERQTRPPRTSLLPIASKAVPRSVPTENFSHKGKALCSHWTGYFPCDSEVPGFSDVEMASGARWVILQPESQGLCSVHVHFLLSHIN